MDRRWTRRTLGVAAAAWPLPIAAVVAFLAGASIGEIPECGTGSSVGLGLGWPLGLLEVGIIATLLAGIAIAGCGRGPVRWLGLLLLVPIEALAATAGTLAGEAAGGCARYWTSQAGDAAWLVAVPAAIVLAPILLVLAIVTASRAGRPERRAPSGPGPVG